MPIPYGGPADVVGVGRVASEVVAVSPTPAIAEAGVALAVDALVGRPVCSDRLA